MDLGMGMGGKGDLGLSPALCGRDGAECCCLPSWLSGASLFTLSEELLLLPALEVPGEGFVSGVMGVFECLVLVLAPSWIVVEKENENLRNAVEPLRAFVFESELVLWLCLRCRVALLG
jgi:hypothetical protein